MLSGFSNSKWSSQALLLLGVVLLVTGQSEAQLTDPHSRRASDDPFVAYHSSLSKAAEKVLAEPVRSTAEGARSDAASSPAPAATGTNESGPAAAVNRVQQLRPIIEPILREEQVPTDLSAIVLVESRGQPAALSRKGARGLWQFMPDTARRYGLIVTAERDERLDVGRSTHAAARYLRDLYSQFGDWQLAFAAYNAGEDRVRRAIDRNGTRDFFKLSSARSLPLETVRYVPAVLDATKMFTANSAIVSIRNDASLWRVYADTQPSNGR
jgi:soluble lytic murein transglycosylase-like protein